MKVEVPKRKTRRGWIVVAEQVRKAAEDLGLKYQITVLYYGPKGYMSDYYGYYDSAGRHHLIYVNRDQDWKMASKTIWHELVHALQKERIGTKRGFAIAYGKHPYGDIVNNPYEREATQIENRKRRKLTRPA